MKLLFHPLTAALATLGGIGLLYAAERALEHMPFVLMSMFALAAILMLLSRRVYFSLYTSLGMVCLLTVASIFKYRNKGFDLHIYDLVFTGTDAGALRFLASEFGILIAPIAAALLMAILTCYAIFRQEKVGALSMRWRLGIVATTLAIIPVTYPLEADEPRYFHYLGGFNASSFFVSLLDFRQAASGRDMLEGMSRIANVAAFPDDASCDSDTRRPDVFVVLNESHVDLGKIDAAQASGRPKSRQVSDDGKHRNLRVETFGGGTWITNFSLMTGLSSLEFGWRAPYLTTLMQNRVNHSLATEFARCGYRTAVQLPMEFGFVNEGAFLQSIGFEDVLDYGVIGASKYAHADRFYFEAARKFIEAHRKSDGRPLFLQIQTMFAHSPYGEQRAMPVPTVEVDSEDEELGEYVRRVVQSQTDFEWFLGQARSDATVRPSVVLEFGDHQSFATRDFFSERRPAFAINNLRSFAYQTYYTVHGFGTDVDMRPFDHTELDIGFLGVSLLDAIGMDKSPMYADLSRLRDLCRGALYFCDDRRAVDVHIGRRVASGFLTLD